MNEKKFRYNCLLKNDFVTFGGRLDTYSFLIGIPSSVCVGTLLTLSYLDAMSPTGSKRHLEYNVKKKCEKQMEQTSNKY